MPTLNKYYEFDANGFLVGWYKDTAPRGNSTAVDFDPIEPQWARFVNGAWVEDHARDDAAAKEVLRAAVFLATEQHVDAVAVAWDYDDVEEAVSYAEEPAVPQYQAEGRALRAWRSVVWAMFESNAGTLTSVEAFLAGLPAAPVRP